MPYIMWRIATTSPRSGSSTTTGRLTIAGVAKMAALGWLMMGVSQTAPRLPVLVSEMVEPDSSPGSILPSRVRAATSAMALARPARFSDSAFLTTGTNRPLGVSTATPRCTSW